MGADQFKKRIGKLVRITYLIEVKFGIRNLYDWSMLDQSPGHICDRVLRSIGFRARDSVKRARRSRKRVTRVCGVPIPEGRRYDALRSIVGKYFPSQQRKIARILEADALRLAGENPDLPDTETYLERVGPSVPPNLRKGDDPESEFWVDTGGYFDPRYGPSSALPKEGDLCNVCGAAMAPCLAQSRTDKYEWIGNEYWDCYGMSQTGLYTADQIAEMFPNTINDHRRNLATRRWRECHPYRCVVDPLHSKVSYWTT
jgi:hypothetical protein